jgi:hypothetical protein
MLHLRSVEHAREVLHPFPSCRNLVHTSVHDEMCGWVTSKNT